MTKKQNQSKRKNKKPLPLFTYFCLLLAVAVMSTGMTFARYATSSSIGGAGGIAAMLASFTVDEISSTSFSNSDYWVNIEGEDVAQNIPREVLFTVRNYKEDINKVKSKASEVDIQSTFRVHGSEEFLGNIAFQILRKGEGNTRIPLTQQYVLPQIIQKVKDLNGLDGTMSTEAFVEDGKKTNYGEYQGRPEETLNLKNLNFRLENNVYLGKFIAEAKAMVKVEQPDGTIKDEEQTIATIALTAENRTSVNYEVTRTRGKLFTVDGASANDMSAPEYYGIHQASNVPYYALDITVPGMDLKVEKDKSGNLLYKSSQYIFAFTIINQESFDTEGDPMVSEHFNVTGIDFFNDSAFTSLNSVNTIKVVNELEPDPSSTDTIKYKVKGSSKYYVVNGETETEFTLNGNVVSLGTSTYYLHDRIARNLNNRKFNPKSEVENNTEYAVADVIKKVYPVDIRVLFTQASET